MEKKWGFMLIYKVGASEVGSLGSCGASGCRGVLE